MVNRRMAIMKPIGREQWGKQGRVTGEGERRSLSCVFHTVQPASADHEVPRGVIPVRERAGNQIWSELSHAINS